MTATRASTSSADRIDLDLFICTPTYDIQTLALPDVRAVTPFPSASALSLSRSGIWIVIPAQQVLERRRTRANPLAAHALHRIEDHVAAPAEANGLAVQPSAHDLRPVDDDMGIGGKHQGRDPVVAHEADRRGLRTGPAPVMRADDHL